MKREDTARGGSPEIGQDSRAGAIGRPRVSSEPGQRHREPGQRNHRAGPEDEHPLDEISPLIAEVQAYIGQPLLEFGPQFRPGFRQALLEVGAESLEIQLSYFADFGTIHGEGCFPPGKQIISSLVSQGLMKLLKQISR